MIMIDTENAIINAITHGSKPACNLIRVTPFDSKYLAVQSQLGTVLQNTIVGSVGDSLSKLTSLPLKVIAALQTVYNYKHAIY